MAKTASVTFAYEMWKTLGGSCFRIYCWETNNAPKESSSPRLMIPSADESMILAVDVDYRDDKAFAAGVLFQNWEDGEPAQELIATILTVAEYEPGQFCKRELPCVLALLQQLEQLPEFIVIDGYVYLDGNQKPGFSKHLYEALEGKAVIIGVAKSRFKDTPAETEMFLRVNAQTCAAVSF